MISYLNELGGSPLVTNGTWDDESFDIRKLFYHSTDHATFLFLDHRFARCKDPRDEMNEIVCFKMNNGWRFNNKVENDTLDILKAFDSLINDDVKKAAVKDFLDFLFIKKPLQDKLIQQAKPEVMKIDEMAIRFPNLDIDWLKVLNTQLMKTSQLSKDDEILIGNPKLMQELLEALGEINKR